MYTEEYTSMGLIGMKNERIVFMPNLSILLDYLRVDSCEDVKYSTFSDATSYKRVIGVEPWYGQTPSTFHQGGESEAYFWGKY